MFELEKALVDVLNNSDLPLDAKYYVVQSVLLQIKTAYENAVRKAETEKKPEKEGEDNDWDNQRTD